MPGGWCGGTGVPHAHGIHVGQPGVPHGYGVVLGDQGCPVGLWGGGTRMP